VRTGSRTAEALRSDDFSANPVPAHRARGRQSTGGQRGVASVTGKGIQRTAFLLLMALIVYVWINGG